MKAKAVSFNLRLSKIQFLWGFLGITRSSLNEPWFPTFLFGASHLIALSNQAYFSFLSFLMKNSFWITLVLSIFYHQLRVNPNIAFIVNPKRECPSITLTINLFLPDCATSTPLESRLPHHLSQRLSHKLFYLIVCAIFLLKCHLLKTA